MKVLSMRFKIVLWFTFIFIVLTFASCEQKLKTQDAFILTKQDEKVPIKIEIAQTNEERARGFMHRKHIPDGTGMLFVFEIEEHLSFWMKDTPTALSIAFIDKAGYIKEIHHMQPLSLEPVKSSYSCLYALEVPQGWFEKVNVQVGDSFEF